MLKKAVLVLCVLGMDCGECEWRRYERCLAQFKRKAEPCGVCNPE